MGILRIAVIAATLSTTASADILSVHCPLGCPTNPAGNALIYGHVYALSNNPETKFADWVAYEVNVLNFGASPGRDWAPEPLLAENETLEEDDYKKANASALEADPGHQAPLASFASSDYWPELNYLSNITPQDKDLNQGPWKDLEEAVRSDVAFRDSLYVITGPLFIRPMASLPKADEPHQVPSAYFKVVYDLSGNAAGFIMKQSSNRNDDYCSKQELISTIQALVDFDLPELTPDNTIFQRLGCAY